MNIDHFLVIFVLSIITLIVGTSFKLGYIDKNGAIGVYLLIFILLIVYDYIKRIYAFKEV